MKGSGYLDTKETCLGEGRAEIPVRDGANDHGVGIHPLPKKRIGRKRGINRETRQNKRI